jgi:hypothetical protein
VDVDVADDDGRAAVAPASPAGPLQAAARHPAPARRANFPDRMISTWLTLLNFSFVTDRRIRHDPFDEDTVPVSAIPAGT